MRAFLTAIAFVFCTGCPQAARPDTSQPADEDDDADVTDPPPIDTSHWANNGDEDGGLPECEELLTKVNGDPADDVDEPSVGDIWHVRMYCDGAVLHGANRLTFSPPELAVVDPHATDATFVGAGAGSMHMQSGNFVYTRDLVVQEAGK